MAAKRVQSGAALAVDLLTPEPRSLWHSFPLSLSKVFPHLCVFFLRLSPLLTLMCLICAKGCVGVCVRESVRVCVCAAAAAAWHFLKKQLH